MAFTVPNAAACALQPIGTIECDTGFRVELDPRFRAGLTGLGEFSHVMVVWLFDQAPWDGQTLTTPPCYRKLDHELGVFATRGPFRPNPIALSVARVLGVDVAAGTVSLDWIDAEPGSPVVDLKPYHPSADLVPDAVMPSWCAHWPADRNASGRFNWAAEFTF